MYGSFSGVSSLYYSVYSAVVRMFSGYFGGIVSLVLTLFLLLRGPYVFSAFCFIVCLWVVVGGSFSSLLISRVSSAAFLFLAGFIPVGTPLWVCPLVCLAETVSLIIRPLVLMLRPFINITLGCVGASVIGGFGVSSGIWALPLAVLFFYEVFVAVVHWFIVASILLFSVDH